MVNIDRTYGTHPPPGAAPAVKTRRYNILSSRWLLKSKVCQSLSLTAMSAYDDCHASLATPQVKTKKAASAAFFVLLYFS
jgi:hypothetical protein